MAVLMVMARTRSRRARGRGEHHHDDHRKATIRDLYTVASTTIISRAIPLSVEFCQALDTVKDRAAVRASLLQAYHTETCG
jgi:hypothetical protein